jgi:hypothetical protein
VSSMTKLRLAAFAGALGFPGRGSGAWLRIWLSLAAGFLLGAALTLVGLAQGGLAHSTPIDRRPALPAPPTERPYVPPMAIGMVFGISISGAPAPARGSAVSWRNGEVSWSAAAFSLLASDGRV